MRLLAIDDEPSIGQLIVDVATDYGFEASAATDATTLSSEALASFDVILLDLLMPGTDGIEVLRRLGRSKSQAMVVLMSGLDRRMLDSAWQVASAIGLQVCDVLAKPFRGYDLVALFDKHALGKPTQPMPLPVRENHGLRLSDLQRAIEADEIVVHYQPQINVKDNTLAGVEALARWQHPTHGLLYPGAFIELAEHDSVALPFTLLVLRKALAEFAELTHRLGFEGTLSVNIPPTALTDVTFPEKVVEMLGRAGVSHKRLIMEVTETSIPQNEAVSLDIETRLRLRGIRLSIDDFGTGHSSLDRLRAAPFDELKIDMVFIRDADRTPSARAIVENAVRLGHSVGMSVVSEGVETQSVLNWLRTVDCDIAQGYFISRPLPMPTLIKWATTWCQEHPHPGASKPAEAEPPKPQHDAVAAQGRAASRTSVGTVLLVEDHADHLSMVTDALTVHGFEVQTAQSGLQALALFHTRRFDVVVTDLQIPELDGLSLIRQMRKTRTSHDLPIIALTGQASVQDRQRGLDAGADVYLTKPVRLKVLVQAIVDQRAARRSQSVSPTSFANTAKMLPTMRT